MIPFSASRTIAASAALLVGLSVAFALQQPGSEAGTAGTRGLPPIGSSPAMSIPAGTKIPVRFNSALSSGNAKQGQSWEGVLASDITLKGGTIKSGTPVRGLVTQAKAGKSGSLQIEVTSIGSSTVETAALAGGSGNGRGDAAFAAGSTATFTVVGAANATRK